MYDSSWWLRYSLINLGLAILFAIIFGVKIFYLHEVEYRTLRLLLVVLFWLLSIIFFGKYTKLKKQGK